jgi:hypothetical protein
MIETSLFTLLSTSAAVSALVGTRVYPATLPKDPTLPAVVYHFVGGNNAPTMGTSGKQRSRLQINCYGETYSDAITLRKAVVQTLAGYSGADFQSQILNATGSDGFDAQLLQYVAICEVYVWFSI